MSRRKTPIQLKTLAGTDRPDRDTGSKIGDSLTETPPPPDWLSEEAKQEWQRLGSILVANRLLPETSLTMFGIFCELGARIQAGFIKGGDELPTASLLSQYRGFASEWGLSPAMISKVTRGGGEKSKNPFAALK